MGAMAFDLRIESAYAAVMLPTLRQLQYLKLLAEHGSFSRAAEAAHVSQPALSAGVQELEKVLGSAVVERTRGAVQLTAVGAEAVKRAEDVLARTEDLVEAARNAGKPLCGRFRLGVIPTIAPFLLPATLPRLKDRHPALRLFLREDLTPRLVAQLKAGQLDAAVIALPYEAAGIDHARIGFDEILAAAPAGHPLALAETLGARDLEASDLILLEDGHCLREQALDVCRLSGAGEKTGFRATSLETLRQMVAANVGATLLPVLAVKPPVAQSDNIHMLGFSDSHPSRSLAMVWRRSSAMGEFLTRLAGVFGDLSEELLSPHPLPAATAPAGP